MADIRSRETLHGWRVGSIWKRVWGATATTWTGFRPHMSHTLMLCPHISVVFDCNTAVIWWYVVMHFVTTWCYASAVYAVVVCLSVTSPHCTKMAKLRITQTTLCDSPWTVVFWRWRSWRNFTMPQWGHQIEVGLAQMLMWYVYVLWLSVHPSVCHKSVFYQNS